MSASPAEQYIGKSESALAVVRFCKVRGCNWSDTRRKPFPGNSGVGRGNGFREGNKQRGRAIQHVKQCHADLLAK
jgi:hypothetical protein